MGYNPKHETGWRSYHAFSSRALYCKISHRTPDSRGGQASPHATAKQPRLPNLNPSKLYSAQDMGNERVTATASSPSSGQEESSSLDYGIQSRPTQSPRKPGRKKSVAATGRRTVIETAGIDDEEAVGEESSEYNPRAFPYHIKQACWEKTTKIKGRDPDRWRRDALGNIVFRKLVGCSGCLCHDYDHIHPYSKGGKSTVENCQVLQGAANRAKSNHTDMSTTDLIQKSAYCRVSGRDMDFLELSAYGNVHRGQESGGCRIQ